MKIIIGNPLGTVFEIYKLEKYMAKKIFFMASFVLEMVIILFMLFLCVEGIIIRNDFGICRRDLCILVISFCRSDICYNYHSGY